VTARETCGRMETARILAAGAVSRMAAESIFGRGVWIGGCAHIKRGVLPSGRRIRKPDAAVGGPAEQPQK
jgi:hypothetical protein